MIPRSRHTIACAAICASVSAALYAGIAVAGGAVFVVTEDGSVTCMK